MTTENIGDIVISPRVLELQVLLQLRLMVFTPFVTKR